jgi:hypothetical protein
MAKSSLIKESRRFDLKTTNLLQRPAQPNVIPPSMTSHPVMSRLQIIPGTRSSRETWYRSINNLQTRQQVKSSDRKVVYNKRSFLVVSRHLCVRVDHVFLPM